MGAKLGKLGRSNLQQIVQVKDQHRCGCYIRRPEAVGITFKNAIVPLKKIDYHLQIVNGLANITLRQIYANPTDQFLEVDYSTPYQPIILHIQILSIVKDKQEAKKEHEKAKQQGRQAVIGTIDPDSKDIFNIEIGNIPPQTQFVLTISIMQELKITFNTFYSILIPATISPRFMNKVDGVVKKPQHMDEGVASGKADYTWSFKINIKTSRRLVFFDSPSHNIILTAQNQSGTSTTLQMGKSQIPNKDFQLMYTTQDFEKPQYVLGSNDQSSTVMLSFVPKFCSLDINDAYKASIQNKAYETDMDHARGDYCFVLDRSGSMDGNRITQARQALLVFLKSLPEDSYFNVISFGDSYEKIFQSSQKATKQILENAIKKVQGMGADLGGTEIYEPLANLLQEKIIEGYPRHVFLLTDGGVSNTEGVIKMVKVKAKNSRVHTIGIGTGASINLIEGCAAAGRGKHIIISDDENPGQKIIQLLQSALTPVITKIKLTCNNDQKIQSIIPNPKQIPYILKDEPANFYITFKQKLTQKQIFNFEYEDPITKQIHKAEICVDNGSNEGNYQFVDKMGHYKVLKALESSARDGKKVEDNMYYVKVIDYEKEAINYSIKHQILSEYTAFSCIGKKLVDGQYQEYKDVGVHKVYVQQAKPMYYQQEAMYYSNNARSNRMMKLAMEVDEKCCDQDQDMMDLQLQEQCCIKREQQRAVMQKCCQQQPPRIQKQVVSYDLDKQIEDFCSKDSEEPVKKQPKIYTNIVQLKQDFSVQDVIKMQNTDGSWTDKTLLKLAKNQNDVANLSKKINPAVVITKLVVLWLQKNHNSKQYGLILKKASAWLKKKITEEGIDEAQLNVIETK